MSEPKLGLLLGAVVHDLASPLNAAQLHLRRFMTHPKPHRCRLDEVSCDALNSALRALTRAHLLCQDAGRLANLLRGESVLLQPARCSLLATLCVIGFEEPVLLRGIDRSTLSSVSVWADPLCLYRVLVNLLRNAQQHGGAQVQVSARVLDAQTPEKWPSCPLLLQCSRAVLLSISDDGAGIPEAQRKELFQPLWRSAIRRERSGAGLGLWLSRQLVRAHGGELWLGEGPGTIFHSLWPLAGEPPGLAPAQRLFAGHRALPLPADPIQIPAGLTLAEAERLLLLETVRQCGGNKQAAAVRLDVSRRSLYNKLQQYGARPR